MATTATKSQPDKPDKSSEIREDASYSLPEFMARTRLGAAAMRQAKRQGLLVRKIGRNKYILGKDWFAHLESAKG